MDRDDEMDLAGIALTLKDFGFKDIRITQAPMSDYVKSWISEDSSPEEMDDAEEEIVYARVDTAQGSFGLLIGPGLMLDISTTGIRYNDVLQTHDDEEKPDDFALLAVSDESTMVRFRELLSERTAARSQG